MIHLTSLVLPCAAHAVACPHPVIYDYHESAPLPGHLAPGCYALKGLLAPVGSALPFLILCHTIHALA